MEQYGSSGGNATEHNEGANYEHYNSNITFDDIQAPGVDEEPRAVNDGCIQSAAINYLATNTGNNKDNSGGVSEENAAEDSNRGNDDRDLVCHDFLRGVCYRKTCKFKHITDDVKKRFVFCHDYQKGRCNRTDCRYVHCTPSEEQHYKNTGQLLSHVQAAYLRAKTIIPNEPQGGASEIAVCKDFLNGICNRNKCKFRHTGGNRGYYDEPTVKRRRSDFDIMRLPPPPPLGPRNKWDLEAENDALRQQNELLVSKVNELMMYIDNLEYSNNYSDPNTRTRSRKPTRFK